MGVGEKGIAGRGKLRDSEVGSGIVRMKGIHDGWYGGCLNCGEFWIHGGLRVYAGWSEYMDETGPS